MDKKTFALAAIAPYYKDPTTCGYEDGRCEYLTSEGKKCVFGKFLLHPEEMPGYKSAYSILSGEKEEDILVPEAVGILTKDEWKELQIFHDRLAQGLPNLFNVEELTLFTKEELEEYIANNPT